MIKRTLYFGNPTYLNAKDGQMVVTQPSPRPSNDGHPSPKRRGDAAVVALSPRERAAAPVGVAGEGDADIGEDNGEQQEITTIPIEDIGVVVLDSNRITITQPLLAALIENNAAVIACNAARHPIGLFLPLESNSVQSERFRDQINASEPLKKQMWQETVKAKIMNQARLLGERLVPIENMLRWAKDVRSGDPDNCEAKAAAYYWGALFPRELYFTRSREGAPPNNLLNYGYAILRAVVARGLVSSGLLPTLGIHHRNKYNAYCLADDIMEPYRPFVDAIVCRIVDKVDEKKDIAELTPALKKELLAIAATDVMIENENSPLMVALGRTTASLARRFAGETKKIAYPEFF